MFGHHVPFSKTNCTIVARIFMVTLKELMRVIVMCSVGLMTLKKTTGKV